MDISDTLAPKSDQLDAIELVGKPRTFTITDVSKGNAEQPVNIHLADFPRVWRPGKSMRRVLAACWGTDASVWVGRRVTLYCDETVTFGSDVTGGTRVSHVSHIPKRKSIPLPVKRGKIATFTVDPLPDTTPTPDDRLPKMLAAYARAGVTKTMLEAHQSRPADDWDDVNLAALTDLFEALKSGQARKEDEFPELAGGAA